MTDLQKPDLSKDTTFWTPSELEAPPTDRPFWAFLHETGIRLMVWRADYWEAEDPGGPGAYVLECDDDEDYEPQFWAPFGSIPDPRAEWAHCAEPDDQGVPVDGSVVRGVEP